jgi:hypothetical protein
MMKATAFIAFLALGLTVSAATIVVNPSNMNGWAFVVESGSGASGTIMEGPGTPPLGTGSAQLSVDAAGDRMLLGTLAYQLMPLAAISTLSYSTYRSAGGPALAPSLQFDIDTDLTDTNNAWMGRLVYEAYYTQAVADNTWQTWDTMATGANWWFSGVPGNAACSIGSPCTWAQVLAAFPNAGVRAGGVTQFKAGGGWTGFIGNVDNFTINTGDANTKFDFESDVPEPTTLGLIGISLAAIALLRRSRP